ncbi:RES family NAD+ phosphorylase [Granulicella sp. S156]|uniref:RES family NAD+ phosphorylase n=1 Tax=Granulicella sp. S156 TaxID=1747224 RepID=UPI00131DC48D|nr:RES family NAD+ phosphorylase [Granulicella sp. S156]
MAAAVCWHCIEDEYLKRIIQDRGEIAECTLCGNHDRAAFAPDDFSAVLDPVMRKHFAQGEDVKRFGEDDSEWWEQVGDPLSHHLQEVIGTYLGFEDEIVEALEKNEDVRPQDGEQAFFDSSQVYVPLPTRPYRYIEKWDLALDELKHRRRFFSSSAKTLFTELFEGVETRQAWSESGARDEVVRSFPQGSEFYRARICGSTATIKEAFLDPLKNVGPTPSEHARSGRMNAEGVTVLYGSLDCETCLAEVRPALGNDTAVIKLRTTKPLRLLDFSRLERSYTNLSYFQPDFEEECEKGVFLRRLQKLISQPIIPGRETDYIITQTLAEYLAHVHDLHFDGVLFQSVQRSEGTNIVLFPDVEGNFPLSYVDQSIALHTTTSIEYKHDQRLVLLTEDSIWIDSDYDEEEW